MDEKLVAACQMFLVPASILFTAIGAARTEGLKTGVSFLGVVISLAWLVRVAVWDHLSWGDRLTGLVLAFVFLATSGTSLVVHWRAWNKQREKAASSNDAARAGASGSRV